MSRKTPKVWHPPTRPNAGLDAPEPPTLDVDAVLAELHAKRFKEGLLSDMARVWIPKLAAELTRVYSKLAQGTSQ